MIEPLMNDKREENLSPLDWVNEQYRDPIGVNTIDQAIKYDWSVNKLIDIYYQQDSINNNIPVSQKFIDLWGIWYDPSNTSPNYDYLRKIRTLEHGKDKFDYWHYAYKHGYEFTPENLSNPKIDNQLYIWINNIQN